jgi:ribosome recycling factor
MERMEKTLEATRSNFNTVRTGRASPSLLDRVEVCVEITRLFMAISFSVSD